MRKAALHNLGCKVNAYETEAMGQMLEAAGYEIIPFTEKADVYIVNTCSVTNVADKKSRQMLHRARKRNPEAVVVAAGCYVQSASEELLRDGAVDVIIGNNRKKDLVPVLEEYFTTRERSKEAGGTIPGVDILDISKTSEYENLAISHLSEHTRAFIKVQDGCNQFCSYCIIPYTRGRVRSRDPREVEREARTLVAAGYQEIVLTGIHLSSYGIDFAKAGAIESEEDVQFDYGITTGEDAKSCSSDLLSLIRRLNEIEGLRRIRLGSLEPRIITEEFAAALASMKKVCPHFHLSLQSGCDATLQRMNRHYTAEDYARRCEILRAAFDNPAITTDVIVGFPGETEEEFLCTKEFLTRIHFYEMHVFKYSRRAGTRADKMPGQVPEPVKSARSDILLKLEREQSLDYRRSFLEKPIEVLLEESVEIDGRAYLIGHNPQYVKAAVPAAGYSHNEIVSGRAKTMLTNEILLLTE